MTNQVYDKLQDLQSITTMPFLLIDAKGTELKAFPDNFESIYRTPFLLELIDLLEHCSHPDGVFLFQLEELYYCAIIQIEEDLFLVTAPACTSSFACSVFFTSLTQYVYSKQIPLIKKMMPYFPVFSTFQLAKFASLCRQLHGKAPADNSCVNHDATWESVDNSPKSEQEATSESITRNSALPKPAPRRHHSPYFEEREYYGFNCCFPGQFPMCLFKHHVIFPFFIFCQISALKAFDFCSAIQAIQQCIFTCAFTDSAPTCVFGDIHHRSECHMNPGCRSLFCGDTTGSLPQFRFPCTAFSKRYWCSRSKSMDYVESE